MKCIMTTREATELNATQGDDSMNHNEMPRETIEEATSEKPILEFLKLVKPVAEARMGSPTAKAHAQRLAKRHGLPASFLADMSAAMKPVTKADMKEFIALLDAALGGRCCYQEMVAAMLDVFGTKYHTYRKTIWFVGLFVLGALKDAGAPDGNRIVNMTDHLTGGGARSASGLLWAMVLGEVTLLFGAGGLARLLHDSGSLGFGAAADSAYRRARAGGKVVGLTDEAEAAIVGAALSVAKANLEHRPAAYAEPKMARVVQAMELTGPTAEFCTLAGRQIGEAVGGSMRTIVERIAVVNPWFVGTLRARNAVEMMRDDAAASAAA